MQISESLYQLCLQVSEAAFRKVANHEGMSLLVMVKTTEGKLSFTNITLDSMEEATAYLQKELISGHYSGSQMYACARHVSWFTETGDEQHAIFVDCEEAGNSPPLTLGRLFGPDANREIVLNPGMSLFAYPDWSAYNAPLGSERGVSNSEPNQHRHVL